MKSFKILVIFLAVLVSGCAGIEKRSTADDGANEEPTYLASCNKPFPIVFDKFNLINLAQHAGYAAMLTTGYPSLDVIAQTALSKSGCSTTAESWYKVRASFDGTGRLMGPTCGVAAGGYYGLFMGNLGGRCVNFTAAKVTLTVFDMRTRKDILSVTAETDASLEDEIAGRRFLKSIEENGGSVGSISMTPEGRIVAGLVKKGLDALISDMSRAGLATLDNTANGSGKSSATPTVPAKSRSK